MLFFNHVNLAVGDCCNLSWVHAVNCFCSESAVVGVVDVVTVSEVYVAGQGVDRVECSTVASCVEVTVTDADWVS